MAAALLLPYRRPEGFYPLKRENRGSLDRTKSVTIESGGDVLQTGGLRGIQIMNDDGPSFFPHTTPRYGSQAVLSKQVIGRF